MYLNIDDRLCSGVSKVQSTISLVCHKMLSSVPLPIFNHKFSDISRKSGMENNAD